MSERVLQFGIAIYLLLHWTSLSCASVVVDVGQQFSGAGIATGNIVNHGVVVGSSQVRFVFGPETQVSGSGRFENTLNLGTFAPGNSPGTTSGTNQAFGGMIEIELGGTTPGFGSGRHDQINDSGTIELVGTSTLSMLSYEDYLPSAGDEFQILTWQTALVGDFGSLMLGPMFTANNIQFEQIIDNRAGQGSLTLRVTSMPEAVPEASSILVWSLITFGTVLRTIYSRWRRAHLCAGPSV